MAILQPTLRAAIQVATDSESASEDSGEALALAEQLAKDKLEAARVLDPHSPFITCL